jgi:hypothetical protein
LSCVWMLTIITFATKKTWLEKNQVFLLKINSEIELPSR